MYYDQKLKIEVVKKVLNKELNKAQAARLYNIKGHSTINKWINKFHSLELIDSNKDNIMSKESKSDKKRIQELERALAKQNSDLQNEKMKVSLLETMIKLAKTDLNIDIKKNYGSKL